VIDEWMKIIPTPGHTTDDVSLEVKGKDGQLIIVAGDLFESEADIDSPHQWMGNSFCPRQQALNRLSVLQRADVIIPGHGPIFTVQPHYATAAQKLCDDFDKEFESTKRKSSLATATCSSPSSRC